MTSKWDPDGAPRKPELIGIGAQKAGTTWLSQMLGQHPQVWTPPFKEVQFFNHRFVPEHRQWLPWHFPRARRNIASSYEQRGEQVPADLAGYLDRITRGPMFTNHWYKKVFAPAPAATRPLDVTPEYSTLPDEGVEFVARFLPKARFVYLIRHPVDRAVSQLKMNLTRARRRPATLDEWLDEIDDPELMERGDYATYVPRWNARFGSDRLLYLPFGRIASDPLGVMRQLEQFFGLDPHDYRSLHTKVFASTDALSVPYEIRAALRARLDHQFRFIETQFGADFAAQIR